MSIKNFRDVYHKLAIVLDNGYCFKLFNLAFPKDVPENTCANSALVYGYIDKNGGLAYQVLGITCYESGDYTLMWPNDEIGFSVQAKDFEGYDIIPIENRAIAKRYEKIIDYINESFKDAEKERLRSFKTLDPYRHKDYPDDVKVLIRNYQLMKQECVWAQLTEHLGKSEEGVEAFLGRLLSQPFEDIYGVHRDDSLVIGLVTKNDGTTILLGAPEKK